MYKDKILNNYLVPMVIERPKGAKDLLIYIPDS